MVRAKPDHPDAWLTNRLISDFVPFDFVARYVFNKQGFYRDYESWGESFRAYVVNTLKTSVSEETSRAAQSALRADGLIPESTRQWANRRVLEGVKTECSIRS